MKVKSINYQKTFNLGNYSSERIGVEVDVDEGEHLEEVFDYAKWLVEGMHNASQSAPAQECRGVEVKTIAPAGSSQKENFATPEPKQPLTKEEKKKQQVKDFIETISTCTSLKSVQIFQKLVEKENDPELTEAYNNKINSFQNQPA